MRSASHVTRCTSHSPRFLCARASTSTNRGQRYDTSRHMWWISRKVSSPGRAHIAHHCRSRRTRTTPIRRAKLFAMTRVALPNARVTDRVSQEVVGSPEQIRTAVTALRGRRPRPLDDGAEIAFRSSGGRTRTPNDRARTCCVADYTTPEGGRHRLADTSCTQSKRSRAARRRARARSLPRSWIDSKSGNPW